MELATLLRQHVVPVMGCTEPCAVGLAVSLAFGATQNRLPSWLKAGMGGFLPATRPDDISTVTVVVDPNIYKNALNVGIPRTNGAVGISISAALGIFANAEHGINLFANVRAEEVEFARELLRQNKVTISILDDQISYEGLYIKATVQSGDHSGSCLITRSHTAVAEIRLDDSLIFEPSGSGPTKEDRVSLMKELSTLPLRQIVELAETISAPEHKALADFICRGMEMNIRAAFFGLRSPVGLKVGATFLKQYKYFDSFQAFSSEKAPQSIPEIPTIPSTRPALFAAIDALGLTNRIQLAQILTAAAADARMSGADVEIMSVAGSGNQGIVATLPIVAIAEHNQRQDGSLLRAVTLSALITIYVTHSVGYLTALCGCIMKAGLGATAGCAYLIERDVGAIEDAIHNMAGNVVGALCDGAKSGCSFKLATSAATAIECAMLAQSGVFIPAGQGIVADSAERSIHSLGKLSRSMQNTDRTIIAILEEFHQGRR